MEGVDPVVGALEAADTGQVGVDDDRCQIPRGETFGAFDPDELEALGAVAGLEDIAVLTGRHDHVGLEREVGVGVDRRCV